MSFTTHKTEAGQTRSHIIFPDSTKLLLHFNMTHKTEVGETRSSLPFPDNNRPNGLFSYTLSNIGIAYKLLVDKKISFNNETVQRLLKERSSLHKYLILNDVAKSNKDGKRNETQH